MNPKEIEEETPKEIVKKKACPECGQSRKRRPTDYGDFTEYQIRCLVAEYCMSVTTGVTGWGVPFTVWVELRGIAKHDKMLRLVKIDPDAKPVELDPNFDISELPDPKMVGSSEYHAIHEVLESTDDRQHAISILDEFISHARDLREKLSS